MPCRSRTLTSALSLAVPDGRMGPRVRSTPCRRLTALNSSDSSKLQYNSSNTLVGPNNVVLPVETRTHPRNLTMDTSGLKRKRGVVTRRYLAVGMAPLAYLPRPNQIRTDWLVGISARQARLSCRGVYRSILLGLSGRVEGIEAAKQNCQAVDWLN